MAPEHYSHFGSVTLQVNGKILVLFLHLRQNSLRFQLLDKENQSHTVCYMLDIFAVCEYEVY